MPCGVTDVVGGSGVRVNTTVVPPLRDCVLPSNITLEKGQSYTYNFPDVEGGLKEGSYSRISETKYYRRCCFGHRLKSRTHLCPM